jgi:replicative DNA helicase
LSLDLTLLRVLKTRDAFERFYGSLPEAGIENNTRILLKDFASYFEANPGVDAIDPAGFRTYFALKHPKLKPEVLSVYTKQIKELAKEPEPGVADGLRERLASVRTASRLQQALEEWDGGEGDLTSALRQINDDHETWLMKRKQHPLVKDRIEDILHEDAEDIGFHWRLTCLNESMRPLRSGDFGIVAARVDTGKSSWFASELSFMAPQVDQLYPGEDRTIIVFNNEGPGKRLKHRLYNAALEANTKQLVQYSKEGTIYERFVKAQGGRDVFKILNVHDYTMAELEDIVKDLNPAIVVIDMLDNVQADRQATNGGTRTDQILEWLYQRARIWAVKYDCAVIATSQLNGDADGQIYPTLAMLANSRTGKAGAADFVLMIGRSASPDLQNSRFISLPKNKKRRDGGPQDPRSEVSFDTARSLFKDPE